MPATRKPSSTGETTESASLSSSSTSTTSTTTSATNNAPKITPEILKSTSATIQTLLPIHLTQLQIITTLSSPPHNINPEVVMYVWKLLEEGNEDFFSVYKLKLRALDCVGGFNYLVGVLRGEEEGDGRLEGEEEGGSDFGIEREDGTMNGGNYGEVNSKGRGMRNKRKVDDTGL